MIMLFRWWAVLHWTWSIFLSISEILYQNFATRRRNSYAGPFGKYFKIIPNIINNQQPIPQTNSLPPKSTQLKQNQQISSNSNPNSLIFQIETQDAQITHLKTNNSIEQHNSIQQNKQQKMQAGSNFSSLENMLQIMNSTHDTIDNENHSKSCKNRGKCGHCTQLNKMLLSAQEKYSKLLSENYVGELTIRYLKQKNKELLHKISKNSYPQKKSPLKTNLTDFNKRSFQQENSDLSETRILIQTFNPKQLKKILSQPLNTQDKQNTNISQQQIIHTQPSARSETKEQALKPSADKTRKQFNLMDLKKKAQQRLKQAQFYKNCTDSGEIQRKLGKFMDSGIENTQFRFY